jgi:hypothetical protein
VDVLDDDLRDVGEAPGLLADVLQDAVDAHVHQGRLEHPPERLHDVRADHGGCRQVLAHQLVVPVGDARAAHLVDRGEKRRVPAGMAGSAGNVVVAERGQRPVLACPGRRDDVRPARQVLAGTAVPYDARPVFPAQVRVLCALRVVFVHGDSDVRLRGGQS